MTRRAAVAVVVAVVVAPVVALVLALGSTTSPGRAAAPPPGSVPGTPAATAPSAVGRPAPPAAQRVADTAIWVLLLAGGFGALTAGVVAARRARGAAPPDV